MTRLAIACFSSALTIGCGTAEASREDGAPVDTATAALVGETEKASSLDRSDADDPTLRRSYAAADMKLHPCVTRDDEGRITGKACPPAFVVFGPYISVPAGADVQLRFDIEARSKLRLGSDVISRGATQFHGSLDDQWLEPRERRSVSYRLHVFDATRSLETRIGVRGDSAADFEITNLEVRVQ